MRFVDETGRRDEISYGILKQTGQVAFSIYDQRTIEEKKIESAIAHGYAFKADTLEDLARQAGIDWKNFEKTMRLQRGLRVPEYEVSPRAEDPHRQSGREGAVLRRADHDDHPPHDGRLRINEKTQILDKNGNVIPGLYAACEITGGIHGATASVATP